VIGLTVRKGLRFGRTSLTSGFVGGLVGGVIGAPGTLAEFGTGVENTFVGSFLGGGITLGIAVAPLARFVAGFVAALMGELFITFSNYSTVGHPIDVIFGSVAQLINVLGMGLAAGWRPGWLTAAPPREGCAGHRLGSSAGWLVPF